MRVRSRNRGGLGTLHQGAPAGAVPHRPTPSIRAAAPANLPIRSTPTCTGRVRRTANVNRSFGYFHGRSSLSTWLRAVLAQRQVDRVRARRHDAPLDDDDSSAAVTTSPQPDPERSRYLALIERALTAAIAALAARDRLRLASYYTNGMTLAETGRLLGEHEATVSRHLARTRRMIRERVEQHLRVEDRLHEDRDRAVLRVRARRPRSARPGQDHAQGFGGGSFYMMRIR